jgi:outer membrane receptor protein involved in Fe transport
MALFLSIAAAAAAAQAEPAEPPRDATADIVVTGERVRRSLRETQSSVYVATQADIEGQPVDRVEQVLAFVPNVQLGNGSEGPAIRGLDTTGALQGLPAFLGGNRPRTTLIIDGRRQTYHEFVFGSAPVWDLERIEVFRSPQTTTQGQNSIAGAIFAYTRAPSFEPEYRARLIAGNFQTRQMSAVASGPIAGDEVAFRVAGDFRYSHTTSRIADRAAGADPNHDVYGQVRAKLLVKPAALPNSQMTLTYSHLQSQAPQIVPVTPPFHDRRDADGLYGTFRVNVDSMTAAMRHDAGQLTTSVTLTAGESLSRRLAFPGLGQARIKGRDWSAEAVVNWGREGPLRAVGGASRTHLALRQFIDLSLISALGRFHDAQDSTGLFGEINATILPGAVVTAGIRYQRDRQNRSGALTTPLAAIPLEFDHTFHAWLPKLSLAYDFSPAVRAGVLVQKAYNPGGTTLRFDIARPDNFEAETLWDIELFARARLGRGLNASANLFYYDMKNAQRAKGIDITGPAGFEVGFADLFNAPKARSYGLEAELDWRPSSRLSSRFALGLLHTRIIRSADGYAEFEGNQFGRSPHLSAAASVDWDATPRLRLSAQVRHHSSYFSDDGNGAGTLVPPATIADARAEYRLHRIILSAYLRNLFDNFAYIERDATTAVLEDPREIGVGIETRF